MNTFGEKLAELRKAMSLTQEEMSERIGVSPKAISRWENDATMPDVMLLPTIAGVFGISIDDLFSANKSVVTPGEFELAPQKAYMSVLKALSYAFRCGAEELKCDLSNPNSQAAQRGIYNDDTLYVANDIAIVSLSEKGKSLQLLDDDHIGELFAALSDNTLRKILKYVLENGNPITAAFAASKLDIAEDHALKALCTLESLGFVSKDIVDIDDNTCIDVFSFKSFYVGAIYAMIVPMLKMAEKFLYNPKNIWRLFRG